MINLCIPAGFSDLCAENGRGKGPSGDEGML